MKVLAKLLIAACIGGALAGTEPAQALPPAGLSPAAFRLPANGNPGIEALTPEPAYYYGRPHRRYYRRPYYRPHYYYRHYRPYYRSYRPYYRPYGYYAPRYYAPRYYNPYYYRGW